MDLTTADYTACSSPPVHGVAQHFTDIISGGRLLTMPVVRGRYASPAVMLSPFMSREASEDEEARLEGRPMVAHVATRDREQVCSPYEPV